MPASSGIDHDPRPVHLSIFGLHAGDSAAPRVRPEEFGHGSPAVHRRAGAPGRFPKAHIQKAAVRLKAEPFTGRVAAERLKPAASRVYDPMSPVTAQGRRAKGLERAERLEQRFDAGVQRFSWSRDRLGFALEQHNPRTGPGRRNGGRAPGRPAAHHQHIHPVGAQRLTVRPVHAPLRLVNTTPLAASIRRVA